LRQKDPAFLEFLKRKESLENWIDVQSARMKVQ